MNYQGVENMDVLSLNQLAKVVYDYCGLDYRANITSLETKMNRRIKEQGLSIRNYIDFLKVSPGEWDIVVELLTINETYFYREDKQLTVYEKDILPRLFETNPGRSLKVWSAACSTGEEPYSLAMTTLESNTSLSNKVQIQGTDINKRVLKHAMNGEYNKRSLSFRRIPENWLTSFFTEQLDSYQVSQDVKSMVSFKYLNLLDEKEMSTIREEYDIIFCRNVLIYFDQPTIKQVATYFYQSLKKGGFLFLGHAENISNMDTGFETLSTNGTFYYRKG